MNIACPQCGFSRDVDEKRFEKGPVAATCPRCSCRFRILQNGEIGPILPPKGWQVMQGRPETVEQEEEEIRQAAKLAYEREAGRFAENETPPPPAPDTAVVTNPWALAPGNGGWLYAFCQTIIRVLFSMPAFARGLKPEAPLARAFIFYIIIGIYKLLIEYMWTMGSARLLAPEVEADPQLGKMLELLASGQGLVLTLLLGTALLILKIYALSFLMYLVYRLISPVNAKFPLVFQIMGYSTAPAILCIVPVLGSLAAFFWGLGCLAIGCKNAMQLTWPQTFAGFVPVFLVYAPLMSQYMSLLGA